MSADPAPVAPPRRGRFVVFVVLSGLILLGVGAGLYVRGLGHVSTDDAFVRADVVQISADVGGKVLSVEVKENQVVHAGDVLVRLDDTDYRLLAAQAAATLEQVSTEEQRTTDTTGAASSRARLADLKVADARRDAKLQADLLAKGATTPDAHDRAQMALQLAEEAAVVARRDVAVTVSGGASTTARIAAAQAAVDQANRQVELAVIHAPTDGIAAKVDAAAGELASKGQPLLAIVPDAMFVNANFKETDLAELCVGAPAHVVLDAWPDRTLEGSVESIGAGTGATFSLLPADNASGNFVKVVQRVPVRIALAPSEAGRPHIPVGLSANVSVETGSCK